MYATCIQTSFSGVNTPPIRAEGLKDGKAEEERRDGETARRQGGRVERRKNGTARQNGADKVLKAEGTERRERAGRKNGSRAEKQKA